MPPTFLKMCQHVKMSNFSLSRVSITCASSRVRAVVHTSLRCRGHRKVLWVWDFNPQNPVDFAEKNLTCLGTKVPRVSLFNAVGNKKLINATLSSDETLVMSNVGRCCVFAWLCLRMLFRNEELSSVSCLTCARTLAKMYCTFNVKMRLFR